MNELTKKKLEKAIILKTRNKELKWSSYANGLKFYTNLYRPKDKKSYCRAVVWQQPRYGYSDINILKVGIPGGYSWEFGIELVYPHISLNCADKLFDMLRKEYLEKQAIEKEEKLKKVESLRREAEEALLTAMKVNNVEKY